MFPVLAKPVKYNLEADHRTSAVDHHSSCCQQQQHTRYSPQTQQEGSTIWICITDVKKDIETSVLPPCLCLAIFLEVQLLSN